MWSVGLPAPCRLRLTLGAPFAVSQFTLCANVRKGSKPDFHGAMPGDRSQAMYNDFLADLRSKYEADRILDGKFGAMMDVALLNDVRSTVCHH